MGGIDEVDEACAERLRFWLGLAGVSIGAGMCALAQSAARQHAGNDAQIQADVMKSLDNKRFKDVKASVQDGVVTLTGRWISTAPSWMRITARIIARM